MVKNPLADTGDTRLGLDHWVRKIPWRRKWQPVPIFFPGKSHGQRSQVGCRPWGSQRVRQHTHMYYEIITRMNLVNIHYHAWL